MLFVQDTLVAIRVTLPEKDEDTDEPSPAESLQMAVRCLRCFGHFQFRCTCSFVVLLRQEQPQTCSKLINHSVSICKACFILPAT